MSELTLSNNILPLCAVIRIENVFPKNIKISDRKHERETMFIMLARSGEDLHFYMNIMPELSEVEKNKFIDFWKNTHSGRIVSIRRNVVEMEVPDSIKDLVSEVDKIPLARVAPNIMRNGSDMYLSLEFCKYSSIDVSRAIFQMLDNDPLNTKTLEYFGENTKDLPYLLHTYQEIGLPLQDFTLITTVWESADASPSSVYSGFFLNDGKYVPKVLSDNSNDILIIKLESVEIKGEVRILCHDPESGLAEVELKSGYLSDLLNEIVKAYSGPFFYGGENINGKSMRYYVLNTDITSVFLKALSRFWKMPGRTEFKNYIYRIENLEDLMKGYERNRDHTVTIS